MPSSIQGTPVPRLLLAAPSSGSGKTTVVCALLQALKDRGLSPAAFKSGPDYIDPMFHRRVLDTPSYNLDLFLLGRHEPGAAAARETLLVLDATTGQNGLIQARQFKEAAGLTGIVLTKLDGTAKGGIVIAIAKELGVPVKLAGVGEGVDDLKPFDAKEYVEAII